MNGKIMISTSTKKKLLCEDVSGWILQGWILQSWLRKTSRTIKKGFLRAGFRDADPTNDDPVNEAMMDNDDDLFDPLILWQSSKVQRC
jgi:hypothetical protein